MIFTLNTWSKTDILTTFKLSAWSKTDILTIITLNAWSNTDILTIFALFRIHVHNSVKKPNLIWEYGEDVFFG